MLNQQETLEIIQKCTKLGIAGLPQTEAVSFGGEHGKEVIEGMLAVLQHERTNRAARKLRAVAAGPKLRSLMLEYTNRKAAHEKRWHEHDTMVKAYNDCQSRGYQPTVATLRKQLDDLLDLGDISTEEYDIGMRFLDGDESRRVGNAGGALGELSEGVRE